MTRQDPLYTGRLLSRLLSVLEQMTTVASSTFAWRVVSQPLGLGNSMSPEDAGGTDPAVRDAGYDLEPAERTPRSDLSLPSSRPLRFV